jgi:REP element-mobilizing transposase RayT
MGQSLVKNYVHIVFSTKNREAFILPEYEQALYAYVGGLCKQHNCDVLAIGGHLDHIHILCLLSKTMALSKLMEVVKSNSSKWMKFKHHNFYWQNGYGAFSVNPTETEHVVSYIQNQHAHHTHRSFQEEFRYFLQKYQIEYDERYVWD